MKSPVETVSGGGVTFRYVSKSQSCQRRIRRKVRDIVSIKSKTAGRIPSVQLLYVSAMIRELDACAQILDGSVLEAEIFIDTQPAVSDRSLRKQSYLYGLSCG